MTTLYSISEDLLALDAILDASDGEISDEAASALDAWFAELGTARDMKIDGCCALIRELDARAVFRHSEARRLDTIAEADARKSAALQKRLREFFALHDLKKLDTPRFSLSLVTHGGKQALEVFGEVPPAFMRSRTVESIDTDKVRAAIESGASLPFATLKPRGFSLRIK